MKFETPKKYTPRLSTLTAPSPNCNEPHVKLNLFNTSNFKTSPPKRKSRIEKAGLFSRLHFLFGIRFIRLVNSFKGKELLTVEDLDEVGHDESCERLENAFTSKYYELWGKGSMGTRLIARLLADIFRKDIYFQIFWQFVYALAKILSAYFLSQMLKYVQDPDTTVKETYIQTIGLFISFIVAVYATHQFNFNLSYVFNKIKTGFMGMIFRKSTRLSHHALHLMSLGKIVNLNVTDLNNFEKIHFLISLMLAPVILLCGWGLLFNFWGVNSFIGIGYLGLLWPVQYQMAKSTREIRQDRSKQTDDRIEGIIEGIQGIETIKYYNWDLGLIQKIKSIRALEFGELKATNYRECFMRAFVFSSHWIASFLIYLVCTMRGEQLKAYLIFPTITLMSSLRQLLVSNTFQGFNNLEDLRSAARKINLIMGLSEVEDRVIPIEPLMSENVAEFENFYAYRINSNLEHDIPTFGPFAHISANNKTIYQPVISNINLNIKRGNLVAVIGDSGSGKSSLLLSFTNEFAKTSGDFRFQGHYAYVAQETVFFPGPLRECIVFGRPYDEDLFWRVLEACCLKDEVKALPNQEMTEITEKGMNLSEGQRARVSLARAIYSDVQVYLLDECLSNLSMKVAKSVFKNCIQGLLKDKTVIMATNLLNLAKYANQIVVMDRGRIVTQGTYQELIANDENIKFISALKKLPKFEPVATLKRDSKRFASAFADFQKTQMKMLPRKDAKSGCSQLINAETDLGLYYQDEKLDESQVTMKTYWKYFTAIFNLWTIIPAILLFVGSESISWLFTLFISFWRTGQWSNHVAYIVIGTMTAISVPLSLLKYLFYFNRTLNASNKLHNKMLNRVFQSPMKFFDRNPSGRIINRFTNDIGILDKFLMSALLDVLEGFVSFWVTFAALWTRQFEIFVSFGVLVGSCFLITAWSYKAISQMRSLELTTKSPMYSLFMIGVRGLSVIRVHGQTEDVNRIFYKKADDHSKANFAYITSVRFMSFLMDSLIELVVIATFAVFLTSKDTPLSSGFFVNKLGLLPSTTQWILRDFIKLHLLMASAARVINFCQNSKNKKQQESGSTELAAQDRQSTKGKIEVNQVQMRYSDDSEFVVNNLTVNIQPGEKVAMFGNSKGGTSSLIGLLTRLYEFEKQPYINSYIKIDDADINDIKLSSLRDAITVIPQTSVLFKDTIRNNLDPWKQHTDEEIWEALSFVGLKDVIEGLNRKLDTKISTGSYVFSLGHQQLLCVARGLLRKSLIFIQDEATSHLDFASEQDLQRRLLKKYEGTTVINITHRLLTISNYDKVLTVQNGETIEFGEPYLLLVDKVGDTEITKRKGCFASAVINMGQKASSEILRNAMVTYYKKHDLVLPQEEDPIVSNNFFEDDDSFNSNEESPLGKEAQEKRKLHLQRQRKLYKSYSSPIKVKDLRRRSKLVEMAEKLEKESLEEIPRENRKRLFVPKTHVNTIQF